MIEVGVLRIYWKCRHRRLGIARRDGRTVDGL